MAIFNCEFDSVAKTFKVMQDGVELVDVTSFSVYKYSDSPSYMSMEQTTLLEKNEDGVSTQTRVWSSAEKAGEPASASRPGMGFGRPLMARSESRQIQQDAASQAREVFQKAFAGE